MKNPTILALLVTLTFASSCKDDVLSASVTSYLNLTAGSARTYEFKNNTAPTTTNTYTVTSTNRDTTINSRSYHVFTNSMGGSEYYAQSGGDYYAYQALPAAMANTNVEILFLKDNAATGTSWLAGTTTVNVPGFGTLTININNTIAAKGLSKTVNAITYTDVIHVSSVISVPGFPTAVSSNIHYYYAPKYGLIENSVELSSTFIQLSVDTDTRLMSANY